VSTTRRHIAVMDQVVAARWRPSKQKYHQIKSLLLDRDRLVSVAIAVAPRTAHLGLHE
jgi:hypothetical protein